MKFGTGLLTSDWHRYPQPPYKGRGWQVQFAGSPEIAAKGGEWFEGKTYRNKHVVVSAPDRIHAQRALNLIQNVRSVSSGWNVFGAFGTGQRLVFEPKTVDANNDEYDLTRPDFEASPNIPLACMIAARASNKLTTVYAFARLAMSLEIMSVPIIELDPIHSDNFPKSTLPDDHVRMIVAITTAYSCIEQLGLEIRASTKNPSVIENAWNPIVKSELETRLIKGRINLADPCYWNLRGKRTKIEMKKTPSIRALASWARHDVRDGEMEITDALAYASFLRSKIAAHSHNDNSLIKVLSVYDVTNTQFLARRLLLEQSGYWEHFGGAVAKT